MSKKAQKGAQETALPLDALERAPRYSRSEGFSPAGNAAQVGHPSGVFHLSQARQKVLHYDLASPAPQSKTLCGQAQSRYKGPGSPLSKEEKAGWTPTLSPPLLASLCGCRRMLQWFDSNFKPAPLSQEVSPALSAPVYSLILPPFSLGIEPK